MMAISKIVVVGCGVVGAMIAYELSRQTSANIVVLDRQPPAQGATGAALGVLMGVISGKVKGRTWRLREASIRRYPTLIAELAKQGYRVPFNHQGIVSLCFDESKLPRWETLKEKRQSQGWPLEIWSPEELQARCPHIALINRSDELARSVEAAIYSPADGQVHPAALTHALVAAAQARGATFHDQTEVTALEMERSRCVAIQTDSGRFEADWVVLSAGLGSAALSEVTSEPLELMPVLGQAKEIELPEVLGDRAFQPVINGDDIQFVPLGKGRYWVGATVEFPDSGSAQLLETEWAEAEGLANLRRGAEGFVGAIAQAKVIKTWSGLRPRPVGQPAPVIKPLGDTENVILATGHYRNGVLLAPATAQQVCEWLRTNKALRHQTLQD
ncbi:MAG: FAD-dependent oxidoreductase [Phormidesmis sp.]